jgi:hypothetical protein
MPNRLKRLARLYDPLALCYGLRKLGYTVAGCEHTFQGVRAVLQRAAPDVDAAAYVAALEDLGAHCDCEVMLNICPETGA